MLPRPTPASRKPINAMNLWKGEMIGRSSLFAQQSTPEGERLVDLITTALEEAGPERRQAAADAARQRFNELVDPSQYHAPYIFGDGDSDDDD